MAKKSPQNGDVSFFENKRKCLTIGTVTLLKNSSGDRRIKITATINLTSDGEGKPDFVSSMFDAIAKEQSAITLLKSSVELEGTAVQFYPTDKNKTPSAKAAAGTLRSFTMTTKKTRGKDLADVMLNFSIYVPASKTLWDWGYELQGSETFAEFAPTQMSFGDAAEPEEATEE